MKSKARVKQIERNFQTFTVDGWIFGRQIQSSAFADWNVSYTNTQPLELTRLNDLWSLYFYFYFHSTGSKIIIRPEEAFIVILVLLLWIGAIGLFIHRWGKIRMLEPYIPKFELEPESHRPSCVLSNLETITTAKRMSLGLSQLTTLQFNGVGPSWNPNGVGIGRGR